jgi:heme-degrading monooxygenase HmoA
MHVVIFEVTPKPGCKQAYLDIAASLRAELKEVDGFLSVERFQSLSEPDKLLSLSFWRDAAAIDRWRKLEAHREAQSKGKNALFSDYRITVAEVMRCYGRDGPQGK